VRESAFEACSIHAVFNELSGDAELADFIDVSRFVVEEKHVFERVAGLAAQRFEVRGFGAWIDFLELENAAQIPGFEDPTRPVRLTCPGSERKRGLGTQQLLENFFDVRVEFELALIGVENPTIALGERPGRAVDPDSAGRPQGEVEIEDDELGKVGFRHVESWPIRASRASEEKIDALSSMS
jgi:hypothetical protein